MAKGLDCGTGNFVVADKDGLRLQRNAFLTLNPEQSSLQQLKLMKVPYITMNKRVSIVGNKAFELANIFNNSELRRPMASGLLNPTEQDSLPVMKELISNLIGIPEEEEKNNITYCVPGTPIDSNRQVDYHEDVIKTILEQLGYVPKAMNEAVALAYSGLTDNELTGITISLGAGLCNIAIMYKGISALTFSTSKSGDFINENVSRDCGVTPAKASYIKEAGNYTIDPLDISERTREQQAIKTYYEVLIRYLLANIEKQFTQNSNMPSFPEPIPIVCGGGTSMVTGFIDVFKEQFKQKEFPIDVSEIKLADEPLTAVARGCLIDSELEEE